jgi:hypothetical protein
MSILIAVLLIAALIAIVWIGLLLQELRGIIVGWKRATLPIKNDDLEGANEQLRDWLENGPRSVLDQLLAETWLQRRNLRRAEQSLSYLRSYVWEIRDPRFLRDLGRAEMMSHISGDEGGFGLYRRAQDVDEEFERDVVASRKGQTSSGEEKSEP